MTLFHVACDVHKCHMRCHMTLKRCHIVPKKTCSDIYTLDVGFSHANQPPHPRGRSSPYRTSPTKKACQAKENTSTNMYTPTAPPTGQKTRWPSKRRHILLSAAIRNGRPGLGPHAPLPRRANQACTGPDPRSSLRGAGTLRGDM